MLSFIRKYGTYIIKPGIYEAVMAFFDGTPLFPAINCTAVTIIPKINNASSVKDFRPIACCTVL
jgi:hypothetical protein